MKIREAQREVVEEFLVVPQNLRDGFPREEAAIDLDGTGVWDEVDLNSAMNHSDIAGGGAEEWVNSVPVTMVVILEREDDPSHVRDGVGAEIWARTVGGAALHVNPPTEHSLGGNDASQLCGLRHDRCVCEQSLAESDDTTVGILLINGGTEENITWWSTSFLVERSHGFHHRGKASLGVARSPAEEFSILTSRFERGDGHPLGGDRIGVGLQDEAAVSVSTRKACQDVGAAREDLLLVDLDPASQEVVVDEGGDFRFTGAALVGRVYAVDADELRKELEDGTHDIDPTLGAKRPVRFI
jgi:hypothetical protein